jgi:hypothetical protein
MCPCFAPLSDLCRPSHEVFTQVVEETMLAGADLRECHFYGAVMRRLRPSQEGHIPGNVNPDVTRPGEVIFTVASGASGFKLQVGDTNAFSGKNGNVDLGF